jgi:excisionase family DNA binding protein
MPKTLKTQEPAAFERRALSIEETAKTCGLSRATLYRLISDGKLTTLKIGARRLVPIGAIDALLNGGAAK